MLITSNGNSDTNSFNLLGYIDSNKSYNQLYDYNEKTFYPDWTKDPLVLKPILYYKNDRTKSIIDDDPVKEIIWSTIINGTETIIKEDDNHIFVGNKEQELMVNYNDLENYDKIAYKCKILYNDTNANLELICTDSMTFIKQVYVK